GDGRGVVAHGAPLCCPVAQIVNNHANTSAPPGASGTVPTGRAPNPRAPNPRARRRPPASRETRRPPRTPPAGRMPDGRGGRCRRGAGAGSTDGRVQRADGLGRELGGALPLRVEADVDAGDLLVLPVVGHRDLVLLGERDVAVMAVRAGL